MANTVEIIIKALDSTKGGFSSALNSLSSFRKVSSVAFSAAVAGSTAMAGAFIAASKSFADAADEMGKLSQKTGLSTYDLSRLKFVAEENSIEFSQLQKSLRAAADEAAKSGQGFGEFLESQADRFSKFSDGAAKSAEAQRLFGKSGDALIPLLNLGAKGLSDATKEAERFTTVIDSQTAATSDEFGDTLERVGKSLKKAFTDGLKEALPFMLEMSRNLLKMVDLLRDSDGTFRSFGEVISGIGKAIAITSQALLNTGTAAKDFFKIFGSSSAKEAMDNSDEFWRKQEDGWKALEKIWAGDIKLPTPKDQSGIVANRDEQEVSKLTEMFRDLNDQKFFGAQALDKQLDIAHRRRMEQAKELQSSSEELARFEVDSKAWAERQKSDLVDNGAKFRAEIEQAYQDGNLIAVQETIKSEDGLRYAQLENNQALIDIQLEKWRMASESFKVMMAKVDLSVMKGALDGMSGSISGLIRGTMNWSQAFKNFGDTLINSVVSAFSEMIAKLIIIKGLGFAFGGLGGFFNFANGGFAGFASGGFTGFGGRNDVAGSVHRGEYVMPASTVNEVGVPALDSIRAHGTSSGPSLMQLFLDGKVLAEGIGSMTRDGRLEIYAGSIV